VEIPRIRQRKRQELETLISEEALLLAKNLRHERRAWVPRLATSKLTIFFDLIGCLFSSRK
jgi:hypothetical protein